MPDPTFSPSKRPHTSPSPPPKSPKHHHPTPPTSPLTLPSTPLPTLPPLPLPTTTTPPNHHQLTLQTLPKDLLLKILHNITHSHHLYPLTRISHAFHTLIHHPTPHNYFLKHLSFSSIHTNFTKDLLVDSNGGLCLGRRRKGWEVVKKGVECGNDEARLIWDSLFSWGADDDDVVVDNDGCCDGLSEGKGLRAVTVSRDIGNELVGGKGLEVDVGDGDWWEGLCGWVLVHLRREGSEGFGCGRVVGVVDVLGGRWDEGVGGWMVKVGKRKGVRKEVLCAGFKGVWTVKECLAEVVLGLIDEEV